MSRIRNSKWRRIDIHSVIYLQILIVFFPRISSHYCDLTMAEGSYEAPNRATQYQSTKRFDNLQADVNQVVDVMKDNMERVLDRDVKLTHLENRADGLQAGAAQFTSNARELKRKYWWKNIKMWAILILVIIVLIIIIVVAVTQSVRNNNNSNNSNNNQPATTLSPGTSG